MAENMLYRSVTSAPKLHVLAHQSEQNDFSTSVKRDYHAEQLADAEKAFAHISS